MERTLHTVILSLLCIFILIPSLALADEAHYFYDDAGRLVRAATGTEGLVYQYDAVGNLLSISKSTIGNNSPILQSINPDVLFIGSATFVCIQGQNLFTTKEVKSNNPSLSIKTLNVTDTEIRLEITVSADALPDTGVNISITTFYGSASIQATLTSSELAFSPGRIILLPGSSGEITASLFPSVGKDVTITLNNSNPSVASVPQLVTIPSSGTTTFTVNALKEGVATIDSCSTITVVFVTEAFAPLPGEEVTLKAGPISVYIETPTSGNTTTSSLPVSVYIETPTSSTATTSSLPVSVYIETPASADTTIMSLPVSVHIEESLTIEDATTSSLPVSVYVETPSSLNTTKSSLPVSVYIEAPTSSNTTTSSLPVSVYIETPSGDSTVVSLPVSTKISP